MSNFDEAFRVYEEAMTIQQFDEKQLDYSILENHIKLLGQLDRLESGAYSIYDMHKRDHVYVSPKYMSLFNIDPQRALEEGVGYIDQRYHPDDLMNAMLAGAYFMKMILKFPPEQLKDFKLVSEYRMRQEDGNYKRMTEQQFVLEQDPKGNIWLALSVLDFSPETNSEAPYTCRVVNYKTKEWYQFPSQTDINLSKREKEILQLLAKGHISKQIADTLFISVNTVNTHRQRIIEKMAVSNTAEAVQYAGKLGILA